MPQFQISGPDGRIYVLHSSDPETIGHWFSETMSRFADSFSSGAYNYFQMRVYPLYNPTPDGRGTPDWCQNASHGWCHEFQFDGTMRGLVEVLNRTIEASPELLCLSSASSARCTATGRTTRAQVRLTTGPTGGANAGAMAPGGEAPDSATCSTCGATTGMRQPGKTCASLVQQRQK